MPTASRTDNTPSADSRLDIALWTARLWFVIAVAIIIMGSCVAAKAYTTGHYTLNAILTSIIAALSAGGLFYRCSRTTAKAMQGKEVERQLRRLDQE